MLNPKLGVTRALSVPALVAFGLRSYSLYLWHWPVRVFLTPRSGLDGPALFVARLAISLVLAELSYRFVEQPFRTGVVARRSGSRGAIAFFGALTAIAAVLVVTIAAPTAIRTPTLAAAAAKPDPATPAAPPRRHLRRLDRARVRVQRHAARQAVGWSRPSAAMRAWDAGSSTPIT